MIISDINYLEYINDAYLSGGSDETIQVASIRHYAFTTAAVGDSAKDLLRQMGFSFTFPVIPVISGI